MAHRLQTVFATTEGEGGYVDHVRALIEGGDFHAVETLLVADLAMLETSLAQLCIATPRHRVTVSGWDDLVEAVTMFEGGPVTAIAIGMGNEPDLAFDSAAEHAPFLTLGIYTDSAFDFSDATREDLLDHCRSNAPPWSDSEEDVEVYVELDGLAAINTALIHHKQRFFFRDEMTTEAPALYIEAVLAGWFRALRFHQAVAAQIEARPLPNDIPVLSGLFGMTPEAPCVHYGKARDRRKIVESEVATLVIKPKAKRVQAMVDLSGSSIRRTVQDAAPIEAAPWGRFVRRLFGRT